MDVQHPVAFVNAVDRTFVDAGTVLDIDARERNDVGHEQVPSTRGFFVPA
jgi:hypothetical protein